jgi:hypothetical protein
LGVVWAASGKLAVLALCVLVVSCGGDDDDGEAGGSDRGAEAREVVVRYFREIAADRSEKACETFLTEDGVLDVYGQASCKGVVDFVPGPVRVESVEQSGDTARVVVALSEGSEDKRVVSLQPEGGSLKIDAIEMP